MAIQAPSEMIRQTYVTHTITSPVGAEVMQALRGNYRGEALMATSENSKLNDMAEELGASVAHHKPVSLKEKVIRAGQGTSIEALNRILDYLDKLPDIPRDQKLKHLVDRLEDYLALMSGGQGGSAGGSVTAEDILSLLREFDSDVTHQSEVLDAARTAFANRPDAEAMVALLDQTRIAFDRQVSRQDVQAGLAMAGPAAAHAASMETDPAALRDSYRSVLRERPPLSGLFRELSKFDLSRGYDACIDTFMQAVKRDLDQLSPSIDRGWLNGMLQELSQLKLMKSVFHASEAVITRLERLLQPEDRGRLNSADLTASLLDFAGRGVVSGQDAGRLLGPLAQAEPFAQVMAANALRGLHADMPDAIFASQAARQQQVTMLDSLLAELVIREEEAAMGATGEGARG